MNRNLQSKLVETYRIPGFLKKALIDNNFKELSPIQELCVKEFNSEKRKNLIVKSPNGTGKTLAFSMLSLPSINSKEQTLQSIILCPTRELALQIYEIIRLLTIYSEPLIKSQLLIGGLELSSDISFLVDEKPHIIVGTMGRTFQLCEQQFIKLNNLKILIIDEADNMFFKPSFHNYLQFILKAIPNTCNICTFSASFSSELLSYLNQIMNTPLFISSENSNNSDLEVKGIINEYYLFLDYEINDYDTRQKLLIEIIQSVKFEQCIIFFNKKILGEALAKYIYKFCSLNSVTIHSDISMEQRLELMNKIRKLKIKVVLCTDLVN